MKKLFLLKVLATLVVTVAMLYPLIRQASNKNGGTGVFASLESIGLVGSSAIVTLFILGVAFYCRSLQKCLSLIKPVCQTMNPKMVWLMFVPFYNIVEDFFIIYNVTRSLEQEAQSNERLKELSSFGKVSGFGWCIAQVISLFPSMLGEIASLIALVFWVAHWRSISKTNYLLSIAVLDV